MSAVVFPTIVSAVLVYVLGALWYSPVLFSKPWMAAQNKGPEDFQMNPLDFVKTLVVWLISAIMFSALVVMTGYTGLSSMICIAIVVFFGFTLVPLVLANVYESTANTVTFISLGYHFAAYIIMALVHSFF